MHVLKGLGMRPVLGVRVTLVSRDVETPYSGMLPGLLRGEYTYQQAHIDLAPLAAMAQARLILGEAVAIDPGVTVTNSGNLNQAVVQITTGFVAYLLG